MAAFLMADVAVPDMEAYRASGYLEAAPRIAAKFGGVYRMRGGRFDILEGEWVPRRMVMIEFPTMEDLLGFYECAEYRPFRGMRRQLTDSRMVAFEALPESLP